jgi:hypothetical protein
MTAGESFLVAYGSRNCHNTTAINIIPVFNQRRLNKENYFAA